MTTGMVYNLATTSTALTSLTLTAIPTTPQQTYVFTFICLPAITSNAWYLKPPSNNISVTPIGLGTLTVPLYGLSSVALPTAYTYILQTITLINNSTTTTPSFIGFVSVSGY